MSDKGINQRHKERWAAAIEENGGDPHLSKDVTHRLQEELRMEWVAHVRGQQATKKASDGKQEDEAEEAEDPGAPEDEEPRDGSDGSPASGVSGAEDDPPRRAKRKSKGTKSRK